MLRHVKFKFMFSIAAAAAVAAATRSNSGEVASGFRVRITGGFSRRICSCCFPCFCHTGRIAARASACGSLALVVKQFLSDTLTELENNLSLPFQPFYTNCLHFSTVSTV